jgi:hypothetical protein
VESHDVALCNSAASYCHVCWIGRGEDAQAHDSGVRGGQAGGCAMRVRYGSWPPIGVPEGAMVPFLRTCLHAVKARIHRRKRQVAILKKLAMDSFFLGERN